jgi:hypothetical protein
MFRHAWRVQSSWYARGARAQTCPTARRCSERNVVLGRTRLATAVLKVKYKFSKAAWPLHTSSEADALLLFRATRFLAVFRLVLRDLLDALLI